MKKVGIIGWRGMVGSVLVERMLAEGDFARIDAQFFSTSQTGARGPNIGRDTPPVGDAKDTDALRKMDVLISCQGGDYTKEMHPRLRKAGFTGYWIDAASALRMDEGRRHRPRPGQPRHHRRARSRRGVRDYIGGNCTVSLMLMATIGLFRKGWVEWISSIDVPGGVRRRREEHARAGRADARARRRLGSAARRSGVVDPRYRSRA